MDIRTHDTTVDLSALERRLGQRACWHEDPAAYRQGVHDALAALAQRVGDDRASVHRAVAG